MPSLKDLPETVSTKKLSNLVWIGWPQASLQSCQVWKTSLKQCQPKSYQTRYELLDPKQGYNHAKFEKPSLNSVHQKTNVKTLVKSENMSIISLEYV